MQATRQISQVLRAKPATDGDGVSILRTASNLFDPFLMIDEIYSDQPLVNGFPSHPHRGMETLTYMREGGFEHQDHMGNRGQIGANSAQWMSAGRGVMHSELPLAGNTGLHGFQLWINLPAAQKMQAPDYQQLDAVPDITVGGVLLRAVAGSWQFGEAQLHSGLERIAAKARVLCAELPAGSAIDITVDPSEAVALYLFDGALANHALVPHSSGITGAGDTVALIAGEQGAKVLVIAGQPIKEPIVQYGPFVMNTREEIDQALADYRNGTLTQ